MIKWNLESLHHGQLYFTLLPSCAWDFQVRSCTFSRAENEILHFLHFPGLRCACSYVSWGSKWKAPHICILSTTGLGLMPSTATALTNTVHYVNNSCTLMSPFLPPFPYPEPLLLGLTFCEGEETHTVTPSILLPLGHIIRTLGDEVTNFKW